MKHQDAAECPCLICVNLQKPGSARHRAVIDRTNECRIKYGEAHDAHMSVNDECPWCGVWRSEDGLFRAENEVECETHGWTTAREVGTTSGFTGAPIYWAELECGCTKHDDSQDSLERVR